MNNKHVLNGYGERMQLLASMHFISEFVTNRRGYKEFDNQEFFNLVIQILCFIMDKSLKGKLCFREDIIEFVTELNEEIYKKDIEDNIIEEIVYYILKRGLRNDGYVYRFSYYDYDKADTKSVKIQLIDDEIVEFEGSDKTNYFLTERGYKLLFSTKEYDDAFQIEISKFIAEKKIINGDYKSAQTEIEKLINLLKIQYDKIDKYILNAKKDISLIKNMKYSEVMKDTFDVLLTQQNNYLDLKRMVTKNLELLYNEDINEDKIKETISDIEVVLDGLNNAIMHMKRLYDKKGEFTKQYEELINSFLFSQSSNRFDFEKSILNRIEENIEIIPNLKEVYKSLFKVQSPNIFSLHVPYSEQKVDLKEVKIDDSGRQLEDEFEVEVNYAELNNKYYLEFLNEIIRYSKDKGEFTLEEFLNNKKENMDEYIKLTRNGKLIREICLFFSHSTGVINMEKIKNEELKRISYIQPTKGFDILYIVSELNNQSTGKLPCICVEQIKGKEISFNTSINMEEKTALKLTIEDMRFSIRLGE